MRSNVEIFRGESNAPLTFRRPAPVRREALPGRFEVFANGRRRWSTENGALLNEAARGQICAQTLDFDTELATNDQQCCRIDHRRGDGAGLETLAPGANGR